MWGSLGLPQVSILAFLGLRLCPANHLLLQEGKVQRWARGGQTSSRKSTRSPKGTVLWEESVSGRGKGQRPQNILKSCQANTSKTCVLLWSQFQTSSPRLYSYFGSQACGSGGLGLTHDTQGLFRVTVAVLSSLPCLRNCKSHSTVYPLSRYSMIFPIMKDRYWKSRSSGHVAQMVTNKRRALIS